MTRAAECGTMAWVVYLWGNMIDVVWYNREMKMKQVWEDLVYTHGYDVRLELRRPS